MTTYRTSTYNKEDLKLFAKIKEMIPIHYNVNYDEINLKSRKREIMEIKHLVRVLMYKNTRMSLKTVGKFTGLNFDHTTILHSLQTWNGWAESDRRIKRINDKFERGIKYGIGTSLEDIIPKFDNIIINKQGDLYRAYSQGLEIQGDNLETVLNQLENDLHSKGE